MRPRLTPLLVGAVAAVAVGASVEALLGRGGPPTPRRERDATSTVAREAFREAADRLRDTGVIGELVYSDRDCVIRRLVLPDLEEPRASDERSCRYVVSPGGWVSFGNEVQAEGGFDGARCLRGRTEWLIGNGAEQRPVLAFRGCHPAWRHDGALTYVHAGELRAGNPCPEQPTGADPGSLVGCSRTLLSRRQIRRALAAVRWIPADDVRIRVATWIDSRTVAVVVRGRRAARVGDSLAIFRGRRLVSAPLGALPAIERVRVSPQGNFVTVVVPTGVFLVDRRGRRLVRYFDGAAAIASSPDERWLALARPSGVDIVPREPRAGIGRVRVPVVARELFWR